MQLQSGDMLKLLGSGIRPSGGAAGTQALAGNPFESQAFSQLLASAQSGAVQGGAPVTVVKGSGIDLTPDQLQRLAPAVDAADVAGVNRLLAVIDGRAVTIDVRSRQVDGEPKGAAGSLIQGCDATAMIPDAANPLLSALGAGAPGAAATGATAAVTPAQIVPLPGAESLKNASLGDLLSQLAGAA